MMEILMGSIPMFGASTVQIRISEASGSLPDKQALRYSLLKQ
nr:MAG TPA: hypothetical protein [Bacteriophage sp.]